MTPDIYKDLILLLPENIAHKIQNHPNTDCIGLKSYVDDLLNSALVAVPEQKTITDKKMTDVFKKINGNCNKKMFVGGATIGLTNNGGFTQDTGENIGDINWGKNIIGGLSTSEPFGYQTIQGGGADNNLYNIALYINYYIKKKNRKISRNVKYALASFIYIKMKCYVNKSKKSSKLLKFSRKK
jgi:hypothetical protein